MADGTHVADRVPVRPRAMVDPGRGGGHRRDAETPRLGGRGDEEGGGDDAEAKPGATPGAGARAGGGEGALLLRERGGEAAEEHGGVVGDVGRGLWQTMDAGSATNGEL